MFGRSILELKEEQKRKFEIYEKIKTEKELSKKIFDIKPNIYGIGIDLRILWEKIMNKIKRKHK